MSQYTAQPARPVTESNGLAVAGFVCSLIGLLMGGLLSPIGLIMCMIAMGRPGQRGLAIAGLIMGLLGSCGLIAAIVGMILAGATILAALGIVVLSLNDPQSRELATDMTRTAMAIQTYEAENSIVPADLTLLGLQESWLRDPWGNRYRYDLLEEEPFFDLVSSGEDGTFGTEHDVHFTDLGETWGKSGLFVNTNEDDGTVTIKLGDRTLTATGDDDGGTVTIDIGDRKIKIVGDEEGGSITVEEDGD
jgi:hypothetical protein